MICFAVHTAEGFQNAGTVRVVLCQLAPQPKLDAEWATPLLQVCLERPAL